MTSQTIIWTALPNGRDGTTLRLSVHVSPRLATTDGTPGTLADFPDFQDWPAIAPSFSVEVGGAAAVPATITSAAPSSALWTGLFGSGGAVQSHAFTDMTGKGVVSFPAGNVQTLIAEEYADVALNFADAPPSAGRLAGGLLGAIVTEPEPDPPVIKSAPLTPTAAPPDAWEDFQSLKAFHAPRGGIDYDPVEHPPPGELGHDPTKYAGMNIVEPQTPTLDLHRVLSLASQHPKLQRLLGIVFDLEVQVPGGLPLGETAVRVVPSWAPSIPTDDVTPWTRAKVTVDDFRAASRPFGPELVDGHLPLEVPDQYSLLQIDVDGAGTKVADLAFGLGRRATEGLEAPDTPEETGLPTLREIGLAVARDARAAVFSNELANGKSLDDKFFNGGGGPDPAGDLYAEDLAHGYRVDVEDDQSGRWHSLVHRRGTFRLTTSGLTFQDEGEGMVSSPPTTSPHDDTSPFYLQEMLFEWAGWSLVARRPGKAIANDPDPTQDNPAVTDPQSTPPADLPLEMRFVATPGTLPRLRYGTAYRARARAVDIAGNSVPFVAEGGDAHATPPVTYGRFDPVQSPTLLYRDPSTPGESDDTLVLRSNFDENAQPSEVRRHVAPPKVPQIVAEQHGVLDRVVTGEDGIDRVTLDADVYAELVKRDPVSWATDKHAKVDPNDREGTRYFPNDHMKVEYISDPLARGTAWRGLPGQAAGEAMLVPFGKHPWPRRETLTVKLKEGGAAPRTHDDGRHLHLEIPKGHVVVARMSCHLQPGDEEVMGLWPWMLEKAPALFDLDAMLQRILEGRHWMFTPFRRVTFVHAVRQPLKTPEFTALTHLERLHGETFVRLDDTMDFSRTSTRRVDIRGSWVDPVDTGPGTPPPFDRDAASDAFSLNISHVPDPFDDALPIGDRHEFGDTKHRFVTYRATATSRFTEYFVEVEQHKVKKAPDRVKLAKEGFVASSLRVTSADGATRYAEGTAFTVDAEAGEITFGDGPAGTVPQEHDEVRIQFLPLPIARTTTAPPVVDVLSSARPAAPEPVYVVPTFAWTREQVLGPTGDVVGVRSTRHGAGLRIYLERPWWSSGADELLGVLLLEGDGSAVLPESLQGRVTEWGVDPVYGSSPVPTLHPTAAAFPDAVATATGLQLDEVDATVGVAGHEVAFDEDRDLWFCDLRVDVGDAYTPFVRLALARYQPHSIDDHELSRVAQVDFSHILPDRVTTVLRLVDVEKRRYRVTLAGVSPLATEAGPGPGTAHLWVERRRAGAKGDDDLVWERVGDVIDMTPSGTGAGATWTADLVTLPTRPKKDEYRLVVEQFERLAVGDAVTATDDAPRLVHTDTIVLDKR